MEAVLGERRLRGALTPGAQQQLDRWLREDQDQQYRRGQDGWAWQEEDSPEIFGATLQKGLHQVAAVAHSLPQDILPATIVPPPVSMPPQTQPL